MNNETQRKVQQNTRIIRLCSIQGMQDMEFLRVQFSKISRGSMPRTPPPHIIHGIGADSLFVFPVTWCLTFSYKNNLHTYGKQMMIPSLDEVEV